MSHHSHPGPPHSQNTPIVRRNRTGNRLILGIQVPMAYEGMANDGEWQWLCNSPGCGFSANVSRDVVHHYEHDHIAETNACAVLCGRCDVSSKTMELYDLHRRSHYPSAGPFSCEHCTLSWFPDQEELNKHVDSDCAERKKRRFDLNNRIWNKAKKAFIYLPDHERSIQQQRPVAPLPTGNPSLALPGSFVHPHHTFSASGSFDQPPAQSSLVNHGTEPFSPHHFGQHQVDLQDPSQLFDWLPSLNPSMCPPADYPRDSAQDPLAFINQNSVPPFDRPFEVPHGHSGGVESMRLYPRVSSVASSTYSNQNRRGGTASFTRHRLQPYTLPSHSRSSHQHRVLVAPYPPLDNRPPYQQRSPQVNDENTNPSFYRSLSKHRLTGRQIVCYGQYFATRGRDMW